MTDPEAGVQLLEFLERHPELAGGRDILRIVRSWPQIPNEAWPPVARGVRNVLQTDTALIAQAWQQYGKISGPVFDKWNAEGVGPPDQSAITYSPPANSRILEKNLQAVVEALQGPGPDKTKVFAAMSGVLLAHEVFHNTMTNAFVGFTKGATGDTGINARKLHFLGLTWNKACPIDLEELRNDWAHGKAEVIEAGIRLYESDFQRVKAELSLAQLRQYIRAAMAG